jgi:hypothetical protein
VNFKIGVQRVRLNLCKSGLGSAVVEDDEMQREMVTSEMGVIQCENAEAALDVLEKMGALLSMMFVGIRHPIVGRPIWSRPGKK